MPDGILHHELHEAIVGGRLSRSCWMWSPPAKVHHSGPLVAIARLRLVRYPPQTERPTCRALDAITFAQTLPKWSPEAAGLMRQLSRSASSAIALDRKRRIAAVGGRCRQPHHGPRTDFNREMAGQGSANVVSGLLGGRPSPVSSCAAWPTWPPAPEPDVDDLVRSVILRLRHCSPTWWNWVSQGGAGRPVIDRRPARAGAHQLAWHRKFL